MSFPKYDSYKDSGIEWLGEVPSHWKAPALGHRYEVALGKMLDGKRISGEYLRPYLRNVDVQWGRINVIDLPEMDFEDSDVSRYSLRNGDLLVCEGGEVGRAAIWRGGIDECFYQKALHRLRPRNTNLDTTEFQYFVFVAATAMNVFSASEGRSTTIAHLPAEALRRYRLPSPPLSEQLAIAAFLDRETNTIDALVEEQKRLIELLKEKRQAVISHAVTKGLDPNAPMKDSGIEWLGKVPSHWNVKRLKHLGSFKAGAGFPHEAQGIEGEALDFHKVNALAQADDDGFLEPSDNTISFDTARRLGAFVFPEGAIVFAKIGAALLLGRVRRLQREACLDNNLMGFLVEDGNPNFVRHMMTLIRFDYIANPGTVPSLNEPQIANVQIALPPEADQAEIAQYLDDTIARFDTLISEANAGISLLQERRSALISAAVTGKIDVRGVASAEAEAA